MRKRRTILIACATAGVLGEKHFLHVVSQYVENYLIERPHQGLGNRRITEPDESPPRDGPIQCRERLGGLLRTYYREAA